MYDADSREKLLEAYSDEVGDCGSYPQACRSVHVYMYLSP